MKKILFSILFIFTLSCYAQQEMASDFFACGLRRVLNDSTHKVGFENKKGEMVLPAQYCQAERFVKKRCAVNMNATWTDYSATDAALESRWTGGKWGIINKSGEFIKPCVYDRSWNAEKACFQYVAPTDSFYFTDKGKIVPIKK